MTTAFSLSQVAGLLRATIEMLHSELTVLPEAITRLRPAPGEWCINEVLGHLSEAERRGYAGRIRQFLAEDNPRCQPWNPAQLVAERNDQAQSVSVLVQELTQLREESIRLVESLTPAQLARQGQHPAVGTLTVNDILYAWIHHDRNHLQQILQITQAGVWPYMGNTQRFIQPD